MSIAQQRVSMCVGRQIRMQRIKNGVSIRQLADQIGVAVQDVSDYETGSRRPTAARLLDIAITLGVPLSSFFSGLLDGQGPSELASGL